VIVREREESRAAPTFWLGLDNEKDGLSFHVWRRLKEGGKAFLGTGKNMTSLILGLNMPF
jgi:hypothetical protein